MSDSVDDKLEKGKDALKLEHKIPIVFHSSVYPMLFYSNLEEIVGVIGCLTPDGEILIEAGLEPSDAVDTIIHELFHVLFKQHAFLDNRKAFKDSDEELITRRLSTGLVTIFLQNPRFFNVIKDLMDKAFKVSDSIGEVEK